MEKVLTIQGHIFEIYAMVSDIYDNVDLMLESKNFMELEGKISMRELTFKFLNRAVSIFPVGKEMMKPKEGRYVKVEAPFLDEISSFGIINFWH